MRSKTFNDDKQYYSGHLLIATPVVNNDSIFDKSVIYIISHNENGAIGLIINHPLTDISCSTIFHSFDLLPTKNIKDMPVYFGGPVETERGFILHSNDYSENTIFKLENDVALSSSLKILKDIATGNGPKHSIFALGYAGWHNGQLDAEIINDNWLVIPFNQQIVFDSSNDKWTKAMQTLGIKVYSYSNTVGHA